jgi:hypothetical protein
MNRFLFIFFIAVTICQAQSISRSDEHLLFKEVKSSQAVLILNDSILFKGNPLHQKSFLHGNYLESIIHYLPFNLKDKTYLVYHGCGVVLEWRNDSIVRIDKSFLHKNQYGAVPFAYNNKLFFWGGYGLFTYKNILTQFNFKTKEWDEVETFGTPPSPRKQAYGIIINNNLYVFSGYEKDEENFIQIKDCEPVVYKLHLPTMQWTKLGKFTPKSDLNSKENITSNFVANNKLYILPLLNYDTTYEIDFIHNTLTTYRGNLKNVYQPYFDAITNEVVFINKNTDGFKDFVRTPLNEFLGKQVSQQAFILPWYQSVNPSTIIVVILGILLVFIFIFYINKRKSHFAPFNGITFHASSAMFYYRGKPLDTLDNAELRILDYLVQNKHRFMSLNELNHLYENEIQKDNFTTVVKRREVALANLMAKLIFITNSNENDILMYRRSPNDKRMKEIKLKDHFIRVK